MCGICGEFHYGSSQPASRQSVERMMAALVHRGPDDEGCYISGQLGLGFRRLSIIDLSSGHQPMSDQTGRIWVVFNGEIYNFKELRSELESHGHVFRTRSDTEVIVIGYNQWGIDVLSRLNGMFGLAIWDNSAKRLVIARDRMGIKLVYYSLDSGLLRLASEVRGILAAEGNEPVVDPASLYLFLRYRYTPSPLTIFSGIRKLAPGTCLIVENGSCAIKRYWNFAPEVREEGDFEDASEELLDIYTRVVSRQLISDVPVGLLLSGGVDSGLLLALMKKYGDSWDTFTVGYGDAFKDDELRDARETASLFKSRHSSVQIDKSEFERTLPSIIRQLEEPIASSSIVPMYHVCRLARSKVKVALVGQGPDELFGGYTRHVGVRYGHYWRGLPWPVRGLAKAALERVGRNESVARALYSLDQPDRMTRYQQVFSILSGREVDGLFKPGVIAPDTGNIIQDCWRDLVPLMQGTDELGGFQFLEIRSSLPDELLMYADKLSMAHSLELRVPYLDQEIVEFVERLPSRFKVRRGKRKWLHKEVCRSYLPEEIIRRKKRGFAVNVVDEWFADSMRGKMNGLLEDPASRMYAYLSHESVMRLLSDHRLGRRDNHKMLFSLVVFEEWLRTYSGKSV